ncbi:MAG: hypothetical protein HN625_04690, partial [Flavobacteriaceae bacterium]|nr:hypothetical protein [Flavobacteriaceae bacterium]
MKSKIYIFVAVFFISISFMNNSKASAELFGSDDEKWKRIFHELEKMNSRLVTLEKAISVFPHPQSTGDVIDQINAQNKRLEDTNSIISSELIPIIQKDLASSHDKIDNLRNQLEDLLQDQKTLKEGLAQDIEQFERMNKQNFKNFESANEKALENLSIKNKKLIDVLEENLIQEAKTG